MTKIAIVFVLARYGRLSTAEIAKHVHCRVDQSLRDMIASMATKEMEGRDTIWALTDQSYRKFASVPDLDPWKVERLSAEGRDLMITRIAKAFGRLRLDKMNPGWKILLPFEERNKKGWWMTFSKYHFNPDNMKANTPAMKPTSLDSKTGLPKKTETKKSEKPKASQPDKANGTPKPGSTPNPSSKDAKKVAKPSASAKSLLNSKPKNPSPLSKSPPVNASDFSHDHPVHKKLAASPSPSKRKAEEQPSQTTPNKRGKLDPSSADKKENGVQHTLKRKASDLSSPSSTPSSVSKKAKSSTPLVNGTKPHQTNGVHVPSVRTDTPQESSSSEDSSSPVELTWHQKIRLAQDFKRYYGRYKTRHEELSRRFEKGEDVREEEERELWAMHKRLEAMKAKIYGVEV